MYTKLVLSTEFRLVLQAFEFLPSLFIVLAFLVRASDRLGNRFLAVQLARGQRVSYLGH